MPILNAPFIAEGGAIATDGQGTLITTKSCLLNPNRNPSFGRSAKVQMTEIERGFSKLGGQKIVWLNGDSQETVTSGHVDGYVLFVRPGVLLIDDIASVGGSNRTDYSTDVEKLRVTTDSRDRKFNIVGVLPPRKKHWRFSGNMFAPKYLNAHVANGAVVTGKFGHPERDMAAEETLQKAFPERDIRMLSIDHIAAGGGGVRCLTQPMPQMSNSQAGAEDCQNAFNIRGRK